MSDRAALRRALGFRVNRVFPDIAGQTVDEVRARRGEFGAAEWNELGSPANPAGFVHDDWLAYLLWVHRRVQSGPISLGDLVDGPIASIERRRDQDEAIAEVAGFRVGQGLRREPWTGLKPADVCVIRLIASEGQHKTTVARLREAIDGSTTSATAVLGELGEEDWLLAAVPYQLPGSLGAQLLTSEPPDPQLIERIRLPYPAVLTFFDQRTVAALTAPEFNSSLILDNPSAMIDPSERGIVGVVLAADDEGRLLPHVQWLISEYILERGWSVGSVVGIWPRSALAGAVANLAAICTWGDWRPPLAPPTQVEGEPGSRVWRRSLQRSAARKAIARGAVTGVHVLDIDPTLSTTDESGGQPGTASGSGRTVRTHWRAGHWQNYRLASRDAQGAIIGSTRGERNVDWHYEGRWVRPTLVAAKPGADTTTTVYVVHPTNQP